MYTRRRRRHNLDSVAIGRYAGEESTTENTVSVGRKAGYSAQAQWAIAIGDRAGEETQGTNAIAIGVSAGKTAQGTSAIAIGTNAGSSNQPAYSIIISSSDSAITAANKGLYIDPIRNSDNSTPDNGNILTYAHETKEVIIDLPTLPRYSADPVSNKVGSIYFNTTSNKVKVYKGTKWVILFDEDDLTDESSALFRALAPPPPPPA